MSMAKNSRNEYLVKNTAIFAIGNMGTRLINFFMVPLYTYAMSTEQYGTVNTIISICSILIPLVMCNIGEAVRRFLLDKESDKYGIQAVELFWFAFGGIVSIIMYVVLRFVPDFAPYALAMSLYVLFNAFVSTSLDYLRGKEMLKTYTACSLLQTLLVASLNIVFLVKLHYGIHGYLWSYVIAYLTCGVIAFIAGKQISDLKKMKFNKSLFIAMSKFSITLVPNSLMWWITNASDKIMVTYFVSAAANGIYSISTKLPTLLSTFNTILMQAWQYSAIKEIDSTDKVEYNNKMFRFYVATVSIVCAGLLLINRPFMSIYVAPEFRVAWHYSPFLICSSTMATLGTFIGTSYYVEKDMKGNLKSATVGAAVNICLNIVLIPWLKVTGAAAATFLSYVVVFIYRVRDTHKYMPIQVVTPFTIKIAIVLLFMLGSSFVESIIGYIFLLLGFVTILFFTKEVTIGILLTVKNKIIGIAGRILK